MGKCDFSIFAGSTILKTNFSKLPAAGQPILPIMGWNLAYCSTADTFCDLFFQKEPHFSLRPVPSDLVCKSQLRAKRSIDELERGKESGELRAPFGHDFPSLDQALLSPPFLALTPSLSRHVYRRFDRS